MTEEVQQRDQQQLQGQLLQQNLELREAHQRSPSEMEDLNIPEFCIRYHGKTKSSRGSEHYLGTGPASTGIAK